mmetsp:Transcript_14904/g.36057  ORF Transcript_14904/g.36057 Transcript_14904/m.36057 type:complete len:209 (+) Transcript_14904:111-737(+)
MLRRKHTATTHLISAQKYTVNNFNCTSLLHTRVVCFFSHYSQNGIRTDFSSTYVHHHVIDVSYTSYLHVLNASSSSDRVLLLLRSHSTPPPPSPPSPLLLLCDSHPQLVLLLHALPVALLVLLLLLLLALLLLIVLLVALLLPLVPLVPVLLPLGLLGHLLEEAPALDVLSPHDVEHLRVHRHLARQRVPAEDLAQAQHGRLALRLVQ